MNTSLEATTQHKQGGQHGTTQHIMNILNEHNLKLSEVSF